MKKTLLFSLLGLNKNIQNKLSSSTLQRHYLEIFVGMCWKLLVKMDES